MCQPTRQDQVQINGTSHSVVRDDPALNPTSFSQEAPREESLQLLRTGQQVSADRGNQKKNCFKGATMTWPLPAHSRVTLCLNHRQRARHKRSPMRVPLVLGPSQGEGTPISGYSSQSTPGPHRGHGGSHGRSQPSSQEACSAQCGPCPSWT